MADNQDIKSKFIKLLVEKHNIEEAKIQDNSAFVEDLGLDSLDVVEMVMAIEEEFDISIPDETAEKIKTVQNAVDYIISAKK